MLFKKVSHERSKNDHEHPNLCFTFISTLHKLYDPEQSGPDEIVRESFRQRKAFHPGQSNQKILMDEEYAVL